MELPPPVSVKAYPKATGGETRSNYISGWLDLQTSYIDNLYPGTGSKPISEMTYSIQPTITIDQTTSRQHRMLTYSPGFTLYRPTSSIDTTEQNAIVVYQYRLTSHANVSANYSLRKTTTPFLDESISGSLPNVSQGVIAPFADLLTNNVDAEFSMQFSPSAMFGGSGTFMTMRYPSPSQAEGMYNSDQRGGSVFYNRRISAGQYSGATYRYSWVHSFPGATQSGVTPIESDTQTQTVYGFYTIYPSHNVSISATGGIQYYGVNETSSPKINGWAPMFMGSVGAQLLRTSFAASYSREISGGGGLVGAAISTSVAASLRRQVARTWTAGVNFSYAINKTVTPLLLVSTEGGHNLVGSAVVEHAINRQFTLSFSYNRLHQNYAGIAAINNNPDSDRGTISLKWQFARPLGR